MYVVEKLLEITDEVDFLKGKTLINYFFVRRTSCFPGLFCSVYAPKIKVSRVVLEG